MNDNEGISVHYNFSRKKPAFSTFVMNSMPEICQNYAFQNRINQFLVELILYKWSIASEYFYLLQAMNEGKIESPPPTSCLQASTHSVLGTVLDAGTSESLMENARLPIALTCTVYTRDTHSFKPRCTCVCSYFLQSWGAFPHGYQVAWAIVGVGHLEKGSSLTTKSKSTGCGTMQTCVKASSAIPQFCKLERLLSLLTAFSTAVKMV